MTTKKETWYIQSGDRDNDITHWERYYGTAHGAKMRARRLLGKYPDDRYARIYHPVGGTTVVELGTGEARDCPII